MNALVTAAAHAKAPHIDYAGLSPFIALTGGALMTLLIGLAPGRWVRNATPLLALATLGTALGLGIWQFGETTSLISGALVCDDLTLTLLFAFAAAGIGAVLLAWRSHAAQEASPGEFFSLLLFSILGMAILVAATNLVTLFLGFELLSIPLYVLCATELRRERSLESGLKYLIVGSVGSATLVYGLALIYGATGSTDYAGIDQAITGGNGVGGDVLLLSGIGLTLVGLAFKASVAPFHQWTPDVYEGAPTPVTAFMAVATKAAALGVLLRLFDSALVGSQLDWAPLLAALAAITIVVGNVGALGQTLLKRMLAYSGVAQAGYLLAGVIVGSQLGAKATVFYLVVYLAMNLAAFAVVVARERASLEGDDLAAFAGLGRTQPLLAWPLTIAMLALAGIPATAGFVGKVFLIDALVSGDYAWLAIVLVIGSMISLGYYLRVVATMWMREAPAPAVGATGLPVIAGGSQEADALLGGEPGSDVSIGIAPVRPQPEVLAVAWVAALATIVLGIVPQPLFELAADAGRALTGIF
ncbi:MAG TPA: NADH-quinone oxidoreductase subunit N [Conexibacter sp.]|nr:NADH-quinone oxidoreductase subunit N [Conexibacter sp.]